MRRRWILKASLAVALGLIAAPSASAHSAAGSGASTPAVVADLTVGPVVSRSADAPPTSQQCYNAYSQYGVDACYGPQDIRNEYNFGPLYANGDNGAGQTIVIFDSYGSPTIRHDLTTFDAAYGISAPPSFKIYEPEGRVNYDYTGLPSPANYNNKVINNSVGWAYEATLDVEWAHAMAPGANIALVVTPNAETEGVQGLQNLENAQRWALANHIGNIWSDSFATTEQAFQTPTTIKRLNALYAQAASKGVTAFFATGDSGVVNVDLQNQIYPIRRSRSPPRARTWCRSAAPRSRTRRWRSPATSRRRPGTTAAAPVTEGSARCSLNLDTRAQPVSPIPPGCAVCPTYP